ncbi:MAG: hypothetical protein N4A57_00875 [Anaeromicrobium sp.]|uniref:type III-A CRISPR-associated protein Cas10/Csm1 n=1 Tax=Anaeromicrobium sp. TaxID=1929132 RepID=UPI0025D5A504|nr:hypothetical protein [Anaeromicrobium sp.]MCT4592817.1 hypothetical protein [Anaeromicrobium sp.]
MKYNTLILAAILKDLQIIIGRNEKSVCNDTFIEKYENKFKNICDVDLLISILKNYELMDEGKVIKYNKYIHIIKKAHEHIHEKIHLGDEKFRGRLLDSIFSNIQLRRDLPERSFYPMKEYSIKNIFPKKANENLIRDEKNLINGFEKGFIEIVENMGEFNKFYDQLFCLILKYMWCIPININDEVADISFYEHTKMNSALIAALYRYHENIKDFSLEKINEDKEKYGVLVGDLSGIQKYIFATSNIGTGGIAKRLRARSFTLGIISELASHKIINKFNLNSTNIIMSSGGKFYILLPNIKGLDEEINTIQKEFEEYLLKEYKGEISLNLAYEKISGNEMKNFGQVLST